MKAGRAIAILVLIAGVVAFFLLRHPDRGSASTTSRAEDSAASPNRESTRRATPFDVTSASGIESDRLAARPPAAPSRDRVASDPAGAARAWRQRAAVAIAAKERRDFGDEVTRLMHLPVREAWEPLLERAKNGDVAAAAAATNIASLCSAESTRTSGKAPPPVSSYFRDLPAAWKPFIDRIGDEQREASRSRVEGCSTIGNFMDTAMLFFDQYIRPGNVDAEIEVAADNKDARAAVSDLRRILAEHDNPRGRMLLGDLLIESHDSGERSEGFAMLEALAETDPLAAMRVAICLADGCGGAASDPAAARPWLEQAAGLGEPSAFAQLGEALVADGDNTAAWAWSLYRLDLALDGCLETIAPMYLQIAAAAQEEARRKALLSPAEQNAGLSMSYAIAGRWEKNAKDRLACAD